MRPLSALVVLYYFPPSGGPGVQRGLKLVKALPRFGITPTVVTVEASAYAGPGEYVPDPSMGLEVPPELRVVRTPSGERRGLKAALQRARLFRAAWTLSPRRFFERQAEWYAQALAACLAELDRSKPDVVLTSSQPYAAHLVGRELRRRAGVPWVADFRDPWTTSWGRSWPSRRAFAWESDREDETLADADVVVANTPGSRAEMLARRPWIAPARVVVVRNGYDPEDFAVPPAARRADELLVVHSGAFRAPPPGAERRGLRRRLDAFSYAPLPYDLTTHSPAQLFAAMAEAGRRATARPVRARLVGPLDPRWLDAARALGVADRVEALGYRAHREATSHVLAADLLYLPTITRTDGAAVSNVPAKTYEYLGSGRPVAALAGPGDVRDLASVGGRVALLEPRDEAGLADLLVRAASGDGPPASPPDPEDARAYRREELAGRMAAVLRAAAEPEASAGELEGR
jgi:glycosyltransferase involved in cell wall biosynthesis